jgi:outer membrane protein assembly factor BamB
MIELRASDLSILGYWSVPHDQRGADTDFGATPSLFSIQSGGKLRELVGSLNKNGVYYAFRREHIGAGPVWTAQIGNTPNATGVYIAPSAWDGRTLYVGGGTTSIAGQQCQGSLSALSPDNGSFLWQDCLPVSVYGAVISAPGIVEASGGNRIFIVGSRQGLTLLDKSFPGGKFWGPASISGGTLYQGDMNGRLYALSPSGNF